MSKKIWILVLSNVLLAACSPVKNAIEHRYKLTEFSGKAYLKKPSAKTLLVSSVQANSLYASDKMFYTDKPYSSSAFANNAWAVKPSYMLFSLMYQSLQASNYFKAVPSMDFAEPTDYRIDPELIELQQNFMKHPSVVQMSVKVVLSDVKQSRVIGSKIFRYQEVCPSDNPSGGVLAANRAAKRLTADVTQYVISNLRYR